MRSDQNVRKCLFIRTMRKCPSESHSTASMHKIVKDDSREMPQNASKRWSFMSNLVGELFTHSGGVFLLVVSFKTFFADLHWYLSLPKAGWRSRHIYAKVKKFQIEATLLRNRGDLPSVTLVEQVLRDVCRFVSATQHACNVGYIYMKNKWVPMIRPGHRRMIIDVMPVDTLTKCSCSRSVPSKTHRIFQDRRSSQMRKCKMRLLLIIQDQKNARNVIEEALFSCWVLHPF